MIGHPAAKTDGNQQAIIDALRDIGATVQDLSAVGGGVPDILVCYREQLWLMEIKARHGKLTPRQIRWHAQWGGPVYVVRSAERAIEIVTGGG